MVQQISSFRWGVDTLRPNQEYALSFIFENSSAGGTALLVDRTGGGKSHVMRCAGCITRGIVLIIVPLLSLAADIVTKFETDRHEHGIIEAIHFDEDIGSDKELRKQLISDMRGIKRHTNRTLFLFISPQRLQKHDDLRSALLALHQKKVFRYIMIDEFHLFCQHGVDFRREIRQVSNDFIRPLMLRSTPPYLLACTATCSLSNIDAFRRLSGVDFSRQHRIWADEASFRQRYINMTFEISHHYSRITASKIVEFLQTNTTGACAAFSNTAILVKKLHATTKEALAATSLPPADLITVHGALDSLEKFHYTRAFSQNNLEGLNF
jgi:superfamily II DNA helicase RecQ